MYQGKEVDCSKNGYWYSNGCYFKADPSVDPARFNYLPNWQPGGAVYAYYCLPSGEGSWEYTWSLNPPPGYGGPGVNPRDLAEQAIKQMQLQPINIGIVPKSGPGKLGAVGLPVWMWVESPDEHTWGPIARTVSAGGVSVTATATVDHVEWTMGDGSSAITCGRGTPYSENDGTKSSPTCGYSYERTSWDQPDHAFTVTATNYWNVTWTGGGQSGTIQLDLASTIPIRIGELQVLNNQG
jgi:hypothetical protein